MSTIIALILGGLISLISAVVGIVLQHLLSIRKMVHESKVHPSRVLYDKQVEFLDALAPLFDRINGYITTIDVWLAEDDDQTKAELKKALRNSECFTELEQLLQKYNFYIPSELLDKLNTLRREYWLLSNHPDLNKTSHAINLLFETQNFVREFVGVDKLSQDLMKALGHRQVKESRKSE